jgi:formylglycine-generating enzyme required for sulfatase activity
MPLDWPAEVNAHEAWAYCHWKGNDWRLLSEAEFNLIAKEILLKKGDPAFSDRYNLNFAYGSPTPVGFMDKDKNEAGFNDIFGNVWDWLNDDFYPLPGFEKHEYYEDFSAPFFDSDHSMLRGGAWATTGTGTSAYYRLWFRRHFFQHAGFRLAKNQ